MRWITRERVKVDRVPCPWLIKKYVDPTAEFHFVPAEQVISGAFIGYVQGEVEYFSRRNGDQQAHA